ncbi:MAG: NAD(P)H-hydrate dehydratase [Chitinophagaceae bacterium]|nr:MAG: NAD(P)H-hydrate dehydratase [Chitinophagaceae bacterium]
MEDFHKILLDKTFVSSLFRPRQPQSHKGDHGHALLVAGSKGRMGAAVIAAKACLRAGAGLLTVDVPEAERFILQTSLPEAMLTMRAIAVDPSKYTAMGIGPAFGLEEESLKLLTTALSNHPNRLLLDADALSLLAGAKDLWPLLPKETIITPHPGEFDRLFGKHENTAAREATALKLSRSLPWVIVLKGHHTMICSNGHAYVNNTGNAGLAKGGSGDALTGMILALLAQGYEPLHAAILAVYLHGLAADITLSKQSVESMLITDVIEDIGKAFKELEAEV